MANVVTVEQIDYLLAGNPNTPARVLDRLACNQFGSVRRHIAENPSTSHETLSRLAEDEDMEVVSAVAQHPLISRELRTNLAFHDCLEVRYAIAENPRTRASILFILAEDENPYVRARALKTIRTYWVNYLG